MISICILNWNCIQTLKQTILLLTEDLKDIEYEIFVYDQASTDGSVDFLKDIQSSRIFPIFDSRNSGNSISRNIMIDKSRYQYILLLDSDIVPIKKSIKAMINFMENHSDYAYIGYDWGSYSSNPNDKRITSEENTISDSSVVNWKDKIALSQYGMFRSQILKQFKFPEFSPFDKPGWGAEDDILGITIFNSNVGLGGSIQNRVYFHNKGSSKKLLGKDDCQRMYMRRIILLYFFDNFLSSSQQKDSLQTHSLPNLHLKCNKYFWEDQQNLGDIATDFLLRKYFPFLQFDANEKNNLLMFGGTIFNHIENANQIYNAKYKNILYFGVGLSKESEIYHALPMIGSHVKCTIIPRGPKSETEFKNHGFDCDEPCGDVLQLFATMKIATTNKNDPDLLVQDIWKPNLVQPKTENFHTIKVANDNESFVEIPHYDLEQFLSLINQYNTIYSSQVHPVLISALLGKPCVLYPKDWRAFDFNYFDGFNCNMNLDTSLKVRSSAQNNIQTFCDKFYNALKMFI